MRPVRAVERQEGLRDLGIFVRLADVGVLEQRRKVPAPTLGAVHREEREVVQAVDVANEIRELDAVDRHHRAVVSDDVLEPDVTVPIDHLPVVRTAPEETPGREEALGDPMGEALVRRLREEVPDPLARREEVLADHRADGGGPRRRLEREPVLAVELRQQGGGLPHVRLVEGAGFEPFEERDALRQPGHLDGVLDHLAVPVHLQRPVGLPGDRNDPEVDP